MVEALVRGNWLVHPSPVDEVRKAPRPSYHPRSRRGRLPSFFDPPDKDASERGFPGRLEAVFHHCYRRPAHSSESSNPRTRPLPLLASLSEGALSGTYSG